MLSASKFLTDSDINMVLDNHALYEICKRNLKINDPQYHDMN